MPTPLRALVLDLMDTVIRDPYREALEAATGRPLRELFALRDAGAYPAFERGELTEQEYWSAYAEVGLEVDVDVFHEARRTGYRWLPGMDELLDDCEGRVLRVAASNYPLWIEELADGLLVGRFERVLASHHLGVRKPEAAFYEELLTELGLTAEATLFVDDREDNVAGARAVGMRAHLFAGADDLRARLRDEGLAV